MSLDAYVDSVALDTATGDQTVSPGTLGFTPLGAIFSGNLRTADGGGAPANWFIGAAASAADERYCAMESEDAQNTADCGVVMLDTGCMSGQGTNAVADFIGDFTSFNAAPAGFSFNLSNAPAAASILNYLLLGGDVTDFETFVFNLGTGSGNKSKTGLAGTPSCVIFFVTAGITADTVAATSTGNPTGMVGWMCADGSQGYCMTRSTDAAGAGDTARRQRTDKCFGLFSVSAEIAEGHFVSMDANGFTINLANTPTANIRVYGVAIYGGVWKAGSFLSTTGTGGGNDVTTSGVNPKVSIFQTYGLGANTTTQVHGKRGFGMCDGTRRWAVAYDDVDAADPTVTDSYLDRTRALISITGGTPTLDDAYDITHGTEKFTYDHEVASGVAIQVLYLVGGDPAGSDASAAGTATPAAVGAALWRTDASAASTATPAAVGATVLPSVGSAAGVAAADAAGEDGASGATIVEADAASAGSSTASGVGAAAAASVSAASGLAVAASVAAALFLGAASAAGVGAASGQSAAFVASAGSSVGLATVSGSGAAFWLGTGSSTGTGTAAGMATAVSASVGSAAGLGVATGSAAPVGAGVGNGAGVATVDGQGANGAEGGADASAVGTATVSGIGAAVAAAQATSAGAATGSAVSAAVAGSQASATGTAEALAVSGALAGVVGNAQGSATCLGEGEDTGIDIEPGSTVFAIVPRERAFSVSHRSRAFALRTIS